MTSPDSARPPRLWLPRASLLEEPSFLAETLRQKGWEVLEQAWQVLMPCPMTEPFPPPSSYEWCWFTSPASVRFFKERCMASTRDFSVPSLLIAVLGEGTAQACQTVLGQNPTFQPHPAKDALHMAQAWLAKYANAPGQRILWPCSAKARSEVVVAYVEQVAPQHAIHVWPLYMPTPLETRVLQHHLQEAFAFQPDMALITSPSTAEALAGGGAFQAAGDIPWVTMGGRTQLFCEGRGLRTHTLEAPSAQGVMELWRTLHT
jgi:uroporphyrinogen-III synthase